MVMRRFLIRSQRHIRGSINSAMVTADYSGKNNAIEDLHDMLFKNENSSEVAIQFQDLDFTEIVGQVSRILNSKLSDETEAATDIEAAIAQAKQVSNFGAGRNNQLFELAIQESKEKIQRVFQQIFGHALEFVKISPGAVEQVISKINDSLANFVNASSAIDHLTRLTNASRGLAELTVIGRRPMFTEEVRQTLLSAIFSESKKLIPNAIDQSVRQVVQNIWSEHFAIQIPIEFDKLRDLSISSIRAQESVSEFLVMANCHYSEQEGASETSGVITVPALSKDQTMDLVFRTLEQNRSFSIQLHDEFRICLLEESKEDYPIATAVDGASTSLPRLYEALPTEFVATKFRKFIERKLATNLTIFKLISANLEDTVKRVYEFAKPLVDLQGLAIPQLNVQPTPSVIVAYPDTYDSEDVVVRTQLEKAFRQLDPNVSFTRSPSGHNSIVVTRMLAGFPASCMAHLEDQKNAYEEASANGHFMHLPLFVSQDGRALKLPEVENQSSHRNGESNENNNHE